MPSIINPNTKHSFLTENVGMVPAHFNDVTNDKIKSNLVKNTTGPRLNHS